MDADNVRTSVYGRHIGAHFVRSCLVEKLEEESLRGLESRNKRGVKVTRMNVVEVVLAKMMDGCERY